jgi:hypothetical protein
MMKIVRTGGATRRCYALLRHRATRRNYRRRSDRYSVRARLVYRKRRHARDRPGHLRDQGEPGRGTGTLPDLQAQPLAVTVTARGSRPRTVTIPVVVPRDFRTSSGATFHARIAVTASTFPACRVGAAGTLTVSTVTETVRLDVCGRRLLDADGNFTLENL